MLGFNTRQNKGWKEMREKVWTVICFYVSHMLRLVLMNSLINFTCETLVGCNESLT